MRAFRLTAPHKTALTTTSQPEPAPGEVLVKVGAAGVCHSDLHIIDAPADAGFPMPLTLGHENAGWVEAVGRGVTGWTRGEPVAVYGISGCGQCHACLLGRENACQVNRIGGPGFTRDGGMAEYVSVPARQLVRIGDLDVTLAAPLTDAGLTPYHAIQLSRDLLRPGATCVVIGVGGLGHMAIQILAATTATRIIAVDVKDEALELAKRLGAHEAIRSDADAAAQIRALVGPAPSGAEVVIDCVCATPTLTLGASVVATGGRLTLLGLGGGSLQLTPTTAGWTGVPVETHLVMPFYGTRAELAEVIALAQAGLISAHIETFPLGNAPVAYERLQAGKLQGRAVILPAA
jgi:propanol-preferring alcohol dehydrogenase